ncbi:RNA polymerase III transcription factor IIIC subunit-domain-containing protein [Russula ochroleuca]|uniref:RNA polymerase III transcription factor IIIC subunit-domain-containing protein n=1 Tax=Russula ochroleuca TaxID=152965 RepID=A0A9P5N210_9AGAM|nr:RNA polymerase III transcription factor IIIC subunit-domain-containing protein [Russula ochroleuca]
MEDSNDAEASTLTKSQKCAPTHELPTAHIYSIEYPGYVRPESVSRAIHSLGGQSSIDRAFRRSAPREDSLFELNLRPDNPFSHPLLGDLVPTNNILLRVVKRKLKKRPPPNDGDDGAETVEGEYTAVAVGVIPKTARFRSMADFQYQPAQDDPLSKLRRAMATLDVDGIRGYRFPQETEDYTTDDPSAMDVDIDPQLVGRSHPEAQHSTQRSNLRLFPPPIFSRQGIPQNYKYVPPPFRRRYNDFLFSLTFYGRGEPDVHRYYFRRRGKTGEEKERLINKGRWKGFGPTSVSFAEKGVPTKPLQTSKKVRNQYDQSLVQKLEEPEKIQKCETVLSTVQFDVLSHACECQLESSFAINLLCFWRWSMEGYHGSIWIRPAARSSGKIVSTYRPEFSLC